MAEAQNFSPSAAKAGVPLRVVSVPELPLDRLVQGMCPEEVLETVPRLFNLCRMAQRGALEVAMRRPLTTDPNEARVEILRDHLFKLFLEWPVALGMQPQQFPAGWEAGGRPLREALFGLSARPPAKPLDFEMFMRGDTGLASVLRKIAETFPPFVAVAQALPLVDAETALIVAPIENSVAARQSSHPVMTWIEQMRGRGPFWRAVARIYDLDALLEGRLSGPDPLTDGAAMAQAARGVYGVRVGIAEGRVTQIVRVTPTDHLLARDGILDQCLASLPADQTRAAALLLDILDPCRPVSLNHEGVNHA